jgi:hypothetical protein
VAQYALEVALHYQADEDLNKELICERDLSDDDTNADPETIIWREVKDKYKHPTKTYDPSTLERIRKFEGVMARAGLEPAVLHQLEEKANAERGARAEWNHAI